MYTHAQSKIKNYESQWKIVEGHQQKNLPKSALGEVRKIYDLAKKENQEAQVIKAAVYMVNLQIDTREDQQAAAIKELEKEVRESRGAAKAILTNLLASAYYSYFQEIRWQVYQRTATANFKKDDVSTWTTEDFHDKISSLYLSSIADETLLKQTRLDAFDAIITKGNTRKLRPTLYDLLTQKALQYFASDERDIKRPSYKFEINQAAAFDPAADFIHRKFETKDSASLEFFGLLLYQKLIAFHINDPQPDALIDIDLQRLQFVRQKSVHPDTDELYYISLSHLADQYQRTPAAAQVWYMKAFNHEQKGSFFKPDSDTANRFERVKAAEICEKIMKENPETEGGVNAYNLLNTIKRQELQFTTEQVNIPDKPFLAFVESRNLSKLFLKIVKATGEIKKNFEKNDIHETLRVLAGTSSIRSWEQKLPDTRDFQQHAVEIKVDALPAGEYVLIASPDAGFNESRSVVGIKLLYVSNIGYVQREADYFILNRETGQPLVGAHVTVWNTKYDYQSRSYIQQKGHSYVADKNGYFKEKVRKEAQSQSQMLEIAHGNDHLFIREDTRTYYNTFNDPEPDQDELKMYLFSDRSLYRPGQTIYYKGIATKGKDILQDQTEKIEIELKNTNDEVIGKATRTVNEFGSFSGSFVLPAGSLNGQFSLVAHDEHIVTFHVEEYKRPRFAVEFDTLSNSYKLGDSITVTGTGTAYAGNQIDGAKVVYRVVRSERFLYPWLFRTRYYPSAEPQEIAHGETITDAFGKFNVHFEAIPNLKTDKKRDPVFAYTVYADVTDINGETRSAQTVVSVGYKSLLLKVDIAEKASADSLGSLKIRTENMNGQFVTAPVTVKIARLSPEKRLIKPRYWQRPDLFVMTKTEFVKAFPNDEYDKETEKESWPEQNIVFEKTAQLKENQPFNLDKTDFDAGFYKIEIFTKDDSNAAIKDVRYIELIDHKQNSIIYPQYISAEGSETIEPGQKTTIKVATAAENAFVISSSGKKSSPDNFSFYKLNAERRTFDITASEADRGGFGVDFMFVKHNRVHQYQDLVNVPWTNKDLKIEYQTFRDKTLPGSAEKWTVKISGYKQDKVAAEMLASMYDASLDQFYPHQWSKPAHWPVASGLSRWGNGLSFRQKDALAFNVPYARYKSFQKRYDDLISINAVQIQFLERVPGRGGRSRVMSMSVPMEVKHDEEIKESVIAEKTMGQDASAMNEVVTVGYEVQKSLQNKKETPSPSPRKNFNETAFFLPDLKTDKDGSITFSFTMPEALTRWKFQALVHTKELAFGYSSKEIVTQKELMVQPNPPRFLREGDQITFATKVVNLSDRALNGKVSLQLFDTESNETNDALFANVGNAKDFNVAAGQSTVAQFAIGIPKTYSKTITWRMVASAGNLSDGEENTLPVLSNRTLVTETLPLAMRGTGSKQFKMEKLINSAKSKTLTNQSLTVEYTSNPAWYAVQALPYLMEYPYDCAEQTWNRYYANSMAANIVASSSGIAKVFETWRKSDTTALLSNLQKNPELKSLLLEETPWVLAAKTEAEQKKNIALLFDLLRMTNELSSAIEKLRQLQNPDGSFAWFKGGPDDRYMTQYIVSGIGHLRKSDAVQKSQEEALSTIIETAIPYLDARMNDDYNDLIKRKSNLKEYTPSATGIQYLYMRSFFPNQQVQSAHQKAYRYFLERAKVTWNIQTKYMQGMIALALQRSGDKTTPAAILKSLKQTAIVNEELGMYWKTNQLGWWWYEAPVEQQALLIEAFQEISNDATAVNDMKTWLLKNKQTNNWESTKATAEACYALLMTGNNWIADDRNVSVYLNKTKIEPKKIETGTGYFKIAMEGNSVTPEMGNIEVQVSGGKSISGAPSWGGVYWQYFEDLDKITHSETPLKLSKKLFIEKNSDNGPVLTPVNAGDVVHVGDKVKVRIELRADRDMEYVHMKDMRASGFEPVNVLSSYKWQDGLGYYESTKDASTNFFFSTLRRGTYVFEYPLFINQEGNFSNGITTIQCMYAPEFTSHSEGFRVQVGKK
ncbi:MG2 domain-containing protein [Dyadobacter chenwenxiniae]|uniref:MG2 domain-containing protein n=1 Tax=Dyadobacter chenwenxiniae TaxID=2906456 RepID=A0A9X1PM87_9BACT|nr:alpha-2-macroglobulin family protein [Dyadobacter chenwenxiniae]MCF0063902.1 MG2 domain-containing protein [Dyadobacter chenwenxiniae]UON82632.1 MG2 domain-containing protein [Dyadobacter chenwenxiniae]